MSFIIVVRSHRVALLRSTAASRARAVTAGRSDLRFGVCSHVRCIRVIECAIISVIQCHGRGIEVSAVYYQIDLIDLEVYLEGSGACTLASVRCRSAHVFGSSTYSGQYCAYTQTIIRKKLMSGFTTGITHGDRVDCRPGEREVMEGDMPSRL